MGALRFAAFPRTLCCMSAVTMSQGDNWLDDYETDSQAIHVPGSDSEESQPATPLPRSGRRPAGKRPVSAERIPDASDDEYVTKSYNVDWTFRINGRKRGGCSERNIKTPIGTFWRDVLKGKLDKAVKKVKRPCEASGGEISLTTTHHGTQPIIMSFEDLDDLEIKWREVDEQRSEWAKLPDSRKKPSMVKIHIKFEFVYTDDKKNPSAAATAEQLQNIRARYGDGAVMTRSIAAGKAYNLMRCPGPPCKNGDHCWLYEDRHIALFPHHVDILIDHLCAGRPLNGHHDVPDTFRRLVLADERDREEREQKRMGRQGKRKRRDSGGTLTNHCHGGACSGGRASTPELVFPTTPRMSFDESWRDHLRAYDVWQTCRAAAEDKESYKLIQDLNNARKYGLELIASNKRRVLQYYLDNEVPEGIAWQYVGDIPAFQKMREEEHSRTA